MQIDILALQALYGPWYGANSNPTNTVYKWSPTTGEMFINGKGQGQPFANKILLTIWDGGGTDTYDMSNYTGSQIIDLRPGAFNKMSTNQLADLGFFSADGPNKHMARGEVFNALLFNGDTRSLIERAKGGSGNDTMTGNQANNNLVGNGGKDLIQGGFGNDAMFGGAGNDILVGGRGRDTHRGDAGADVFRFSAISAPATRPRLPTSSWISASRPATSLRSTGSMRM